MQTSTLLSGADLYTSNSPFFDVALTLLEHLNSGLC